MRADGDLLQNIYKHDRFYIVLKEIYDKYKNHRDRSKQLFRNERDLTLFKFDKNFTRIPNILLNQLTEINFNSKDCFKVYIFMYRFMQKRNSMTFKCKKEYLRKITKINRTIFERILKELQDKNMVIIEKENSYFYFTLNMGFENWNLDDGTMSNIEENNNREIEKLRTRYIEY